MKKSAWISFCGWVLVALGSVVLGIMVIDKIWRPGPYPIPAGLAVILIFLCFPFGVLWFFGTIIHKIQWSGAQMKAKALPDEAQARAGGPVAAFPTPSTVENVPPTPAAGKRSSLTCQVCKTRSAALFCTAHGVPICMPDLDTHDTPHCVYVPAARVQVVGAGPPPSQRRAAPSVLGLGNA